MRKDDLRLTYVGLGLAFPQVERYRGSQLPDLYAKLCARHEFENFEMHGVEGASIGTEGTYNLDLKRSSLLIEEHAQRDFTLIRKDFADMVATVQNELRLQVFFEPRYELRALWPLEDQSGDVADALMENVVSLKDDQIELLDGLDVKDVGLHVRADEASQNDHGHFELELMPYFRDSSQLHIRAITWRHSVMETPKVVDERMQEVYDYFADHVAKFISSFMP